MKPIHLYLAAAYVLCARPVAAQVPQLLNYQGRVTVGTTNFDGTGQFKFALINATGTTNFWSNDGRTTGQPVTAVALTVTKGLYSVLLGDTNVAGISGAIASLAFTNSDVRLRVWFNDGITGFQQLSPDQRIAAVGYALIAANLDPTADVLGQRLLIGAGHNLSGLGATIAGGYLHDATNNYATVSGGLGNVSGGAGATVAGGVTNTASGLATTVAGGELNLADGVASMVGGGWLNGASTNYATVAGGLGNYASGVGATVAGGVTNLATGLEATVAGGEYNGATGTISSVGGGYDNLASGYAATVPGGYANVASGAYSFAAGAGAAATNFGAFVWADAASTNVVYSTVNNQFTARCAGGVRFFTSPNSTTGMQLAAGGGGWLAVSDRNLKENFKPVDTRAVLAKLVATPVTEWNLITQDPAIRHIGPMAQDFKAAFRIGEDERHINSTDADGVAFAAIQGLHELVKEKDARIAELEKRLSRLEARMDQLDPRLEPGAVSVLQDK
ncbi:MAG: tail fiber domain-containing protein [Verrucomicrobiota bacterium]